MIDMGLNYNTRRERNACIHKKINLSAYTVKVLTKSRKLNICVRAKCLTALPVFTIIVNAKGICNTIHKIYFRPKKREKMPFRGAFIHGSFTKLPTYKFIDYLSMMMAHPLIIGVI